MGAVLNNTTRLPIENAIIIDIENKNEVTTNGKGAFTLKNTIGNIQIIALGYEQKTLSVTSTNTTIALVPSINELDEVHINQLSIPIKYKYATESVSIISSKNIQRGNPLELAPVLNRVPGVFMQSGTFNTNRITIRGIGARNLFGTASIRAYFGDIPLTDGNGESTIEDLELDAISSIEIHKGPSSSTYGVGLGGTILLQPENIEPNSSKVSLFNSIGSYGLRRTVVKASHGWGYGDVNIVYSNNHVDGYRDNNEFDKNTISATSHIQLGKKDDITLLGSYNKLKAFIPSSLSLEDFTNTPRQAAFTWGRSQGNEDVDYGIIGVNWRHTYTSAISLSTSIFASHRANDEDRPFNILEENTSGLGIRSRLLGEFQFLNRPTKWSVGGEFFIDTYNGKTFENLFEDFPIGTGSVQGVLLSDLDEKRNYYNVFAETIWSLSQKIKINLGLHLNTTQYEIDDRFLEDANDSSGSFNFDPILSPKVGFNYVSNPHFTLFGNIAHGFSTPTTSETLLPDGIFNPDIRPETGWSFEIGSNYKLFQNKLKGTLSIYTLLVDNLLVARRTQEDNFFAINAGKTTHNGIEASLDYTVWKTEAFQLYTFFNTTINDFSFKEFVDLENDFSGNDLTGVPSNVTNLGVDFDSKKGWYGNINFQIVDKIPVNDANSLLSDDYQLLHAKIGYKNIIFKKIGYQLFFGANNILDTQYASQIQVNARGFGSNDPRFFYPGLPFNAYGGININYDF